MFRIVAVLVLVSLPAAAQQYGEKIKRLKIGSGCVEPIKVLSSKIRTCLVTEQKTRIWCPNGDVIERADVSPNVPVLRSLCGINQSLD
jgi:hypothetical protein